MSNQEAIALLRNLEDSLDSYCELSEEGKTAFRMAIEALSSSEFPNSSDTDCISRRSAIDALRAMQTYKLFAGDDMLLIDQAGAMTELMLLPPAEPKRGRWIYCEDTTADCVDGYRCDQCGFFVPWDYKHKGIDFIQDYNFCPNCGADMRGEQDG